jgi:MarR family transcriptional regulator, multiple antibiotic resistance protein MarR
MVTNMQRTLKAVPLDEQSSAMSSRAHENQSFGSALKSVDFLLSRVRRALYSALDARLASDRDLRGLKLSAAQLAVVATLGSGKAVSVTEICERTSYDPGAMTRMLDRLQVKRVIGRRRGAEDRRVVYVELTEEGRAKLPRMREISIGVLDQLLGGFTRAEVEQLQNYLTRLLANAESRSGATRGAVDRVAPDDSP